jgi:hypothetical protein
MDTKISILGYDTVYNGEYTQKDRSSLLPVRQSTWRNIPEDWNIHEHRCENLKSCTKGVILIYATLLDRIIRRESKILSAVLHNKTVNNTIHRLLFDFLYFYYEKDACLKNEVCTRESITLSRDVIEDGLIYKSFWLIYNASRTSQAIGRSPAKL